ncbi:MAG TPA: 50S ribosomal protein L24 [Candidatus Aminicenantes bacterium]|nr:50S ribosomal protein L24 [Candidatus Aminicenantes bacterium]
MAPFKLKKNDPVIVTSGRRQDRKKTGKVLRVVADKNRVVVEKVHVIKEYVRPNPQKNIKGGIVEREGAIPLSQVMYYCKECEKGVRVGYKGSGANKQRVCRSCGVVLD